MARTGYGVNRGPQVPGPRGRGAILYAGVVEAPIVPAQAHGRVRVNSSAAASVLAAVFVDQSVKRGVQHIPAARARLESRTTSYLDLSNLDQAGYRARNDDGDETTATWIAAENTPWSQIENQVFRLRFVVDEVGTGDPWPRDYELQYNLNGAGWNPVDAASAVARSNASAFVANNTPTTRQLTSGTGAFIAGTVDTNNGHTGFINLDAEGLTEVEYSLRLVGQDVQPGDTVEFRVVWVYANPDGLDHQRPFTFYSQTASLTVVESRLLPLQAPSTAPTDEPARLHSRISFLGAGAEAPVVTAGAHGRLRVGSTAAGANIAVAQASGRVRVRDTSAASVTVLAQVQGRIRLRDTAQGGEIQVERRVLRAKPANQPLRARLDSRTAFTITEHLAQASGRVRVGSRATASVVVQAAAQGRVRVHADASGVSIPQAMLPVRAETPNQPAPARLTSRFLLSLGTEVGAQAVGRVRVRATVSASVVQVAQAHGRVRVTSSAVGSSISQLTQAIRALIPNSQIAARLHARIQDVRPPAGVVTAQAAGRVRVRAVVSAAVTTSAVAHGRVRVRSVVSGARVTLSAATGRIRVRSKTVSLQISVAAARGRLRVRARTLGTNITRGSAAGRLRVRSRTAATKTTFVSVSGRIRVRSGTVADVFGQNFVLSPNIRGRVKLWSRHEPKVFDGNPRWPQSNDPDSWTASVGVRWPQTNDPDSWPG